MPTFMERWQKLKSEKPPDAEQLLIDYKEVFGTESGKRVLRDLERLTTFSRPSVTKTEKIDLNRVLYNEAQRAVFLYIVKKINAIPKEKERKVQNAEHN